MYECWAWQLSVGTKCRCDGNVYTICACEAFILTKSEDHDPRPAWDWLPAWYSYPVLAGLFWLIFSFDTTCVSITSKSQQSYMSFFALDWSPCGGKNITAFLSMLHQRYRWRLILLSKWLVGISVGNEEERCSCYLICHRLYWPCDNDTKMFVFVFLIFFFFFDCTMTG